MGLKYIKMYESFSTSNVTLDEVFSECNVFIEDLKKCKKGSFLIRGVNTSFNDAILVEHDWYRFPRDMKNITHDKLNDLFVDAFGWKVRCGIFCFPEIVTKDGDEYEKLHCSYGRDTYLLFPKDSYSIVFNDYVVDLFAVLDYIDEPSEDLAKESFEEFYGENQNGKWENGEWIPGLDWEDFYKNFVGNFYNEELVDTLSYYVDGYEEMIGGEDDLKKLFDATVESVVNCDEYYLVNQTHLEEIIERIWN